MFPAAKKPVDVNAMARKINVDNQFPLRNYYRIADNLLKQANIYRAEKNILDLYIILLRYSSLVSETIPFHRDYQASNAKDKSYFRKMLLTVMDELESLKPEFKRQLSELEKVHVTGPRYQYDVEGGIPYAPAVSTSDYSYVNNRGSLDNYNQQFQAGNLLPSSSQKPRNEFNRDLLPSSIDTKFQNLSLGLPPPKQETLSRHSFFGPNGLRGEWPGPTSEIKVNYPSYSDLAANEIVSLNQVEQDDRLGVKDGTADSHSSTMESVLSLDDGRWPHRAEEPGIQLQSEPMNNSFSLNIRQPSPPPVLAQVHPEHHHISPSRVADPRPGPAKSLEGMTGSGSYQDLHIPVKMMEDFLRLARENTRKNLETCGVLAGSLKNRVFHITALIIPKQESTSDSCQTLNEEEIFDVQDKRSLFPLGWIHTHPTQTCFMSSVDLHTHYSYQIMLPEAVAIVMAPTDESSPHGIFHLSDPGGVGVIRNCQQRGFHPHEEPEDGSSIYEHCSHVYMNPNIKFDVLDLR